MTAQGIAIPFGLQDGAWLVYLIATFIWNLFGSEVQVVDDRVEDVGDRVEDIRDKVEDIDDMVRMVVQDRSSRDCSYRHELVRLAA